MIYLFYGDNQRAARTQIGKLVDKYVASVGSDFGLHMFSEESEPAAVVQAVTTVPMFSEATLVVLHHPSRSKPLIDHLEPYLDTVPDQTVLVVNDPSIDKRTTWYKTLQRVAKVKEFRAKTPAQLKRLVESRFNEHQRSIEPAALEKLVEYVDDEWRLEQEVEKLLGVGDVVREADVEALVQASPQQTVFTMLEAVTSGKLEQALAHYDDVRAQNVHELEILALIGWQLRVLLVVSDAAMDDKSLAQAHGINPYVIRKARPIVQRVDTDTLLHLYRLAVETDHAIKTTGHSHEGQVEKLLLEIVSRMQRS